LTTIPAGIRITTECSGLSLGGQRVAADAVAVVAALPPAVVATLVSGLPLSSAWEAPSVQTVVARFNTDVAQLQTDWQDTISAANFRVYVAGLRRAPAPDPGSAAASVLSSHSRSAKPAATARAKAAATTRVAIVGGQSVQLSTHGRFLKNYEVEKIGSFTDSGGTDRMSQ
jgi:hypothetical protein